MKQMICLMSEQLIPSYLAVKHHQPDRVWRILTEVTQKAGRDRMFCETIRQYSGLQVDLPNCGDLVAEPTNFESTRHIVTKLLETVPDDEWIINVSGGNKMIAAGAILAGVIADRPLTYTDIANPNHVVDPRTGKAQPFGHGMNVLEFLSLYGFSGRPNTWRWPRQWLDLAQQFATDPPEDYPFIHTREDKEPGKYGLKNYRNKFCNSFSAELQRALAVLVHGPDLNARQYGFVAGTWLEAFLFELMERHERALGINDVVPGIWIARADVENQLDIALTRGLDFIYIECKAGRQKRIKAGDQIEEILGTLTRLRALRAKALIATTGANFLGSDARALQREAAKRLREAGMNVLVRPDIVELATRRGDTAFIVSRLTSFLTGTA